MAADIRHLSRDEISVGQTLLWDVYDAEGCRLMKGGVRLGELGAPLSMQALWGKEGAEF